LELINKIARHIVGFDYEDSFVVEEILSEISERDYKALYVDFVRSEEFKSISLLSKLAKKYKIEKEAQIRVEFKSKYFTLVPKVIKLCEYLEKIVVSKNINIEELLQNIDLKEFKSQNEPLLNDVELNIINQAFGDKLAMYRAYQYHKLYEDFNSYIVIKSKQKTNLPVAVNNELSKLVKRVQI